MIKNIIKLLIVFIAMSLALVNIYSINVQVLNTNPAPIIAGEYSDVTLMFTNPSVDTLTGLSIKIKPTNEFFTPSQYDFNLANLYSKQSITRTFRVFFSENIPGGIIELPILISYGNLNLESSVKLSIQDVQSNPEILIGKLSSIPVELLPDSKNNKLIISLQNLGNKNAQLVTAKLIVNETKIIPSNSFSFRDSVSSINSGNQSTINFNLDVEKGVFGNVDAKLLLTYRAKKSINNSYKIFNKEIPFTIPIVNSPYLKIVKVEQLDPFTIGSTENRIRVTLKNIGKKEAKEVRIRVIQDSSYPFAYEKLTQYVTSKIDVGKEATIEFKLEVLSVAQDRIYPTTLLLESLVSQNRYVQEDSMDVKVIGSKKWTNFQKGYMVLALIFIVSIILGTFRILNRKKSKN